MSVDSLEATLVHARAEHCSKPVVERGQQIVRFEGSTYIMVGIYFARAQGFGVRQNGDRELYYILKKRPFSGTGGSGSVG